MTWDNSGPAGELPKGAGTGIENHGISVWIHPSGKVQLLAQLKDAFLRNCLCFLMSDLTNSSSLYIFFFPVFPPPLVPSHFSLCATSREQLWAGFKEPRSSKESGGIMGRKAQWLSRDFSGFLSNCFPQSRKFNLPFAGKEGGKIKIK